MQVDMNVETREAVGKGVARTLRQRGKIPGVLYGQGECISLTREIPAHILVDPTPLKINQGIHVKEVSVPPNVRILDDPDRMVVSVAAPISEAKLEALLATTPAGETAAEPELIGKAKEEEVTEEAAAAGEKVAEKAGEKAGAKAGEKVGAKAAAAPAAEAKEDKKEGKEAKDTKGEKKK